MIIMVYQVPNMLSAISELWLRCCLLYLYQSITSVYVCYEVYGASFLRNWIAESVPAVITGRKEWIAVNIDICFYACMLAIVFGFW